MEHERHATMKNLLANLLVGVIPVNSIIDLKTGLHHSDLDLCSLGLYLKVIIENSYRRFLILLEMIEFFNFWRILRLVFDRFYAHLSSMRLQN